jgi:hypothetical protein
MTQVGLEGTGELVGAAKKSVDESGTETFAAMIAEKRNTRERRSLTSLEASHG